MWRNWAGDQHCAPFAQVRAASREDVAATVQRAAADGRTVRAVGAGHSFTDIALTNGYQLSLDPMDRVLDADRESGLVRVQGGISIRELNQRLWDLGLAMENLGDIDSQSIAGAVSTATHGTGGRLRGIAAQLSAVELVTGDGSVVEVDESDAESLRAARVGLGALGIVTAVTLRAVPAFVLEGVDAPVALDDVLASLDERVEANDHFEFFFFPHADVALTRTNNRVDRPPAPRSRARAWREDVLLNNHAFHAFCLAGRVAPGRIPWLNRTLTRFAGTTVRLDRGYEVFASPRLVRFTETEYAVPRARALEALQGVRDVLASGRFAVPFPIECRFVAGDDAFLSTANGRDTCYVAVHMFKGMEWEPYFRAVEEVMDGLDGRPHWGKRHFQTAETLRSRYPDWDRFAAVRARLDPDGRFANAYTDRVLGRVGVTAVAAS
ncbi:MAG: L-gulono,4-lactone dehydrogenase [Solirubrobacteraceae bacterium]|jgi:L-gulonolactone oxidase|nr:L-gulono,4-lactone dehydrogenase [Solirubrobacteraceae bacterium]